MFSPKFTILLTLILAAVAIAGPVPIPAERAVDENNDNWTIEPVKRALPTDGVSSNS
jgi:hypothetical protein